MLLKHKISMWLPVSAHRSLIAHGCSVENCSLNFFRCSLSRGEKFEIFSWLCRFCSNFFSFKKGMFSQLRACVALFSPVLAYGAFIDEKGKRHFSSIWMLYAASFHVVNEHPSLFRARGLEELTTSLPLLLVRKDLQNHTPAFHLIRLVLNVIVKYTWFTIHL